jgi:OsmC-like protein
MAFVLRIQTPFDRSAVNRGGRARSVRNRQPSIRVFSRRDDTNRGDAAALAARSGIAVVDYVDEAEGWLERADRGMRMTRVRLRPHIVLENGADPAKARQLVDKAHEQCFIGNSVLTSVTIEPRIEFATTTMVA